METQSLSVHETSKSDDIAPTGVSQAQDAAKTLPLNLERLEEKRTVMGINGGRDPEKRYGLFRNDTAKFMWDVYSAAMKGENGENSDVDEEVLESRILYIARFDA